MLLLFLIQRIQKKLLEQDSGSPLAIGVGDSEYYFGSDATPFLEFTKRCIYLNDNENVHSKYEKRIDFKRN